MNRTNISVLFLIFWVCGSVHAQWVKEDDSSSVWFDEGIYLSQEAFFSNQPDLMFPNKEDSDWRFQDSLFRQGIVYRIDRPEINEGNFDLKARAIVGRKGDSLKVIALNKVWGACILGIPYMHQENSVQGNFIRIPVLGTVSYLNYALRIEDNFMTMDARMAGVGVQTDFLQLIVDFSGKRFLKHNRKNLEKILESDKNLYQKYKMEKGKSKAIYRYIKLFNEAHPLTF